MKLNKPNAEIFIPDGKPIPEALSRTTVMAVSAHQDDMEIMATDGILKCFGQDNEWFTGVVITNGRGSARGGLYASYNDNQMEQIRKLEQKKAAFIGEYAAQFLLNYSSDEAKDPYNKEIVSELKEIILKASPSVIYTHNLADKHETHLAAVIKVIWAIRGLPKDCRPKKLYGCEVWRDLDWLPDDRKIVFDLSEHENISASLIGIYDSQINGSKRYDLAALGRRMANATFSSARDIDTKTSVSYAMDLTALIEDDTLNIKEYLSGYIKEFEQQALEGISKLNIIT